MPPHPSDLLVQVVSKIPLFSGLSPTQVRLVLSLCDHRIIEAGETLCRADTPSDNMFILVAGELALMGREGAQIAEIEPVASIGEAEFITRKLYAATVETSKASHVFVVPRSQFERMLRRDLDIEVRIYKNITGLLAARMGQETAALEERVCERRQYEVRLSVLERQLKQQAQKTEVALELLTGGEGISRQEAEVHIADKMKDLVPRILVVDDEPEFRRFVRDVLRTFAVMEAQSGREAMQIAQEEPLDLIIADIRMPEMDGCTLVTNLRSLYPNLRVVGVSGFLESEDVQSYGFDSFIDKPMGPEKLLQTVEAALSEKSE